MNENISPAAILKSHIASCDYGIWLYDRHRLKYPDRIFIPDITFPYDFYEKKNELADRIEAFRHLELVNPYLFPQYEECEEVISDYINEKVPHHQFGGLAWPEIIKMPRSKAYPEGGMFSTMKIKLPSNLFNPVEDRFFECCNISLTCISDTRLADTFWMNLNPGYLRKESLAGWKDDRLGCITADATLIVVDEDDCRRQLVPAVMAILVQAYADWTEAQHYGKAVWASLTTGRRRYADNIDKLMLDSGDRFLNVAGHFLKQIPEIYRKMDSPLDYECPDGPDPYWSDPKEAVEEYAGHLKGNPLFDACSEAWKTLIEMETLLDCADSPKVVETWNRCAKQKAGSKKDILAIATSKYLSVCQDICARLAQNIIYDSVTTGHFLML